MKKPRCLFIYIYNEPVFFPIWLKYYERYFSREDIYIYHIVKPKVKPFDDAVRSGVYGHFPNKTEVFEEENVHNKDYTRCAIDMVNLAQKVQRNLLEKYETVLMAEADEIVYHPLGLDVYMDNFKEDVVRCNGFEIIQKRDIEPPLDLERPIMEQRSWWDPARMYSKPLMTRRPVHWCWGFHGLVSASDPPVDPDLYLVHLRRMDFNICRERNISRISSEEDLIKDMEPVVGFQGRLGDWVLEQLWMNAIDGLMYNDVHMKAKLLEIPDHVKKGLHI